MRKFISSALTGVLLVTALVSPAVAQEDPMPAGDSIYLPFVASAGSAAEQPTPTEITFPGSININEEPVFNAPPKADGPDDPVDAPDPAPEPVSKDAPVEPAAIDGWTTLLNDGFEGVPWPSAGWRVFDANGATNGTYYWDDESYRPYRGGYSAWPAGNALNPASYNYQPNQRTWMIYGPFSLQDAAKATLTFQYWSQTELNYDYMGWFASPDDTQFFGNWVSGDSGGWRPGVIDFQNVPGYGSMLGDGSVWIGFYFHSDGTTQLKGPFIDDVFVQKYNCPGQFTAFWFNAITPSSSTQRAVTCAAYPYSKTWGTGGEPWTNVDNFSLQLSGRPYFSVSKTWTFETRSDDGVRVWVDGVLVLDHYYDQDGSVARIGTRYLTAGYHDVFVQYYERTGGARLSVRWY